MECIILGSGPSLLNAERSFLDSMPTYGCNQVGLVYKPTYFLCFDTRAMVLPITLETAKEAKLVYLRNYVPGEETCRALYHLPNVELVNRRQYVFPGERNHSGSTSTYIALKIAFFKGFDTVYLIGIDHNLEHIPGYVDGIQPWMENRERHYRIAAAEYKKAGRRIVNLSRPSILDQIFT